MGLKRHDDYLDWFHRPPRPRQPLWGRFENPREAMLAIVVAYLAMLAFILAWIYID